ncbi:MAG: hypothetical protein GF383_12720 [Candidatus Lokiarchaeota archaeon]|nr:hypothetical protein [Candidatus Lokiarchaeota archaeon]MBD3341921.1 hypothetical protein [Candidatus Lokiarchaeota archaeon]
MFYCSAAEGQRFQEEVTRISKIIEELGSNPLKGSLTSNKDKRKDNNPSKKSRSKDKTTKTD